MNLAIEYHGQAPLHLTTRKLGTYNTAKFQTQ